MLNHTEVYPPMAPIRDASELKVTNQSLAKVLDELPPL